VNKSTQAARVNRSVQPQVSSKSYSSCTADVSRPYRSYNKLQGDVSSRIARVLSRFASWKSFRKFVEFCNFERTSFVLRFVRRAGFALKNFKSEKFIEQKFVSLLHG
jgi:hypothetical protein